MLKLPFALSPDSGVPLYQQIYQGFAREIRTGAIPPGEKLPGKRTLSQQLAVAVNTVDTAYQMLVAEGYLEARAKSGFYVLPVSDSVEPTGAVATPVPPLPEPPVWRYDLTTGGVDTRLFPFRTWGRIQKELLYDAPELLSHGNRQGDANLREAIRSYLATYRGVVCSAEQIVVGAGTEYLLGLAGRLLHGTAAVENPGYLRGRKILENNGLACCCVPIDDAGMELHALYESGASVCCVTPSHHFPTGVTMPVLRRSQLLKWAAEKPGRYIIEDDYDAEFRFDMRPLPSLQGMAGQNGPVIYLSTFSKSLAPSIRIACMVLPPELLLRYREMFGTYANTVSRFEQQTLCRFLENGHFTRHLSRMRKIYKYRSEALVDALQEAFGPGRITLRGKHTGLHLVLTLKDGPGEAEMVRRARDAGIGLMGLRAYYLEAPETAPENTVILGYASLPDEDIESAAKALAALWI